MDIHVYDSLAQFFPFATARSSFIEELDKRIMVIVHDFRGVQKHFFGILRSFDKFGNITLQNTVERIYVGDCYGEKPRGSFMIRGDTVILLGVSIKENEDTITLKKISYEQIVKLQNQARQEIEAEQRIKKKMMRDRDIFGFDDLI